MSTCSRLIAATTRSVSGSRMNGPKCVSLTAAIRKPASRGSRPVIGVVTRIVRRSPNAVHIPTPTAPAATPHAASAQARARNRRRSGSATPSRPDAAPSPGSSATGRGRVRAGAVTTGPPCAALAGTLATSVGSCRSASAGAADRARRSHSAYAPRGISSTSRVSTR